jgi:hypothetical protein
MSNQPEIMIKEKDGSEIHSVDYGWDESRSVFSVVDKDTGIEHQFIGAWFSKMEREASDPSIVTETVTIVKHC